MVGMQVTKEELSEKTKMCAKQQPLRIVYLTAGAGGMYCGSCLRDNTLVRFLRRTGADAQLIPFYTPLRTDESDLSENQLFFGGIRLYLSTKSRFFRRIPRRFTGWMDHRWLVNKVASRHIETDPSQLGPLTLDMLAGHQGPLESEVNRLCQWLESQRPDLINLSNLLIAGCVSELKRRLNVPVLVTLQGDDLFLDQLPVEFRTQVIQQLRNIAGLVDGFIVNSCFYSQKMQSLLGIPPERIHQVPLGINLEGYHDLNNDPPIKRAPTIGYLARLAPEKGLHLLIESFIQLRQLPNFENARLVIAGWNCNLKNRYLADQLATLRSAGAEHAVELRGEVDRAGKLDFFESVDLLCVPTTYEEPKGLFALEAMAAGIPAVLPNYGVFPELGNDNSGVHLVPNNDPAAISTTLARLLADPSQRRESGAAGRRVIQSNHSAEVMAKRTLQVYHQYCDSRFAATSAGEDASH